MIDGAGAVFNENGDSVLNFRIESDTDANCIFVKSSTDSVGFGTNSPSAKVHIIKTTEQLRVGYDASNYFSTTVGSTGIVTLDAVGSGSAFTFSDPVTATQLTSSGLTAGRVTFAGTAGILVDDADFTFATDTLTVTKIAATTFTGNITANAAIITTPQALSGAGAINLTTSATDYTSTGAAEALTLADGTVGQIKTITHIVKGTLGTGVLTPTTKTGYTTVTFNNAGDSVTLRYCTTAGWCVIGSFGVVIA